MKEYYYYIRDNDNHPRVTVCLIEDSKGGFHRGISLCSFDEKEIDKEYGRRKARSRALHALHTKEDSMPIASHRAVDIILRTSRSLLAEFLSVDSSFGSGGFKSLHLVTLTDFERKIIG